MYEDADEVESICSIQNETQPVIAKMEKKPFSDFPHEVELRFQCTPDSARQRMNRYIISDNNRLDESAYNYAIEETENLAHSMRVEDAATKRTSSNSSLKPGFPKIQKWQFFRQILCVDCC